MMQINEFIAFIFRLINFGILIGFFYYLFKKYLLKTIQQKIADKKKQVKDLVDRQQELEHTQQKMDKALAQQMQLCTSLKEQISQWRARVELELAHRIQEKRELQQKLIKCTQKKSDWLRRERIKQHVLPVAIHGARDTLQKKFALKVTGRKFLDKIMDYMKKNGS